MVKPFIVVVPQQRHLVWQPFLSLFFISLFTSCGMETNLVNSITKDDSRKLPSAQPVVVRGFAPGMEGGSVSVIGGHGRSIEEVKGSVGMDLFFSLSFPGTSEFNGVMVSVVKGSRQYLGIIPNVPRQTDIFKPIPPLFLGAMMKGMEEIGAFSTTVTLMLTAKALALGKQLGNIPPDTLIKAAGVVFELLEGDQASLKLLKMVEDIIGASEKSTSTLLPFAEETADLKDIEQMVNSDYLEDKGVGIKPEDFKNALSEAVKGFEFDICYSDKEIRVVFILDFTGQGKDKNCQTINRFKWASDLPGKKVYFTGSVHKETVICGGDITSHCLSKEDLDRTNQKLSNWKPNILEMFDDGTHGDFNAGDGLYTITFDLPYIPVATSPFKKGLRIGYKYTYGYPSQGWTESEEWPGNQRILEIEDVTGDRIVVRYDIFGDETSNKDKANLLSPVNGGCGVNKWENEKIEGCASDTLENMIDTDTDCKPDSYPTTFTASPIGC